MNSTIHPQWGEHTTVRKKLPRSAVRLDRSDQGRLIPQQHREPFEPRHVLPQFQAPRLGYVTRVPSSDPLLAC